MTTKGKPTVRKGAPKSIKESPVGRKGVVRLTESELERAELILNAKAISDRLQKMAEDLAKIEADDLLPLLDPMRTAFGQQVADQFNRVVTEKSRAAMEAIKSAKDGVGIEISRLEASMGGKGTSDMAMNLPPPEPPMDEPAAPPADDDTSLDDVEDQDDDIKIDKGGDDKKDPFADLFADDDEMASGNAAGRAKKESVQSRRNVIREGGLVQALRRSADPDLLILSRFRMRLREGMSAEKAVRFTAHEAAVDVIDVVQIVKEAAGRRDDKRVLEGKVPPQFLKHTKKKTKDGIDDDGDGTPDWADKKPFKKGDKGDRKVSEAKKMKDDPCWKGYEMVGMKKKGGKEVPNCVPTKESKEAGKSTRPFVQAAGNGRLREAITPQRKAELQAMGYAVNASGRGFAWVQPKPGTTANLAQQNTASNDENTAWMQLDNHVKTQTRMQAANNGNKPKIIKPVGPTPPNPPNKPGVMPGDANRVARVNERAPDRWSPSAVHTEQGKMGTFSVHQNGETYSVFRMMPSGGFFQRAANLSLKDAKKAAKRMADGLTEAVVDEDLLGPVIRFGLYDDLDRKVRVCGHAHGEQAGKQAAEAVEFTKNGIKVAGGRGEHLKRFVQAITDVVESLGEIHGYPYSMRQLQRSEGNDRVFPRERWSKLVALFDTAHEAAKGQPVSESDRKPSHPREKVGPSRRERFAIFGPISPEPSHDGTWMTIFDDIVKNVKLLGDPKIDPYNNANHPTSDWAREVSRHQARATFKLGDYEIMVENTGNAIYGFAENFETDEKDTITYGKGEGKLDRIEFITKVRNWVKAAKRGESLRN